MDDRVPTKIKMARFHTDTAAARFWKSIPAEYGPVMERFISKSGAVRPIVFWLEY